MGWVAAAIKNADKIFAIKTDEVLNKDEFI